MPNRPVGNGWINELLTRTWDSGFGTIWRIREDLWREVLSNYPWSGRLWHPAVSLRSSPFRADHSYVPMLHGVSGDQGPVVARGLTEEGGEDYPTSFGKIRSPGKIVSSEFNTATFDSELERWSRCTRVAMNFHKPRLDQLEASALRKWWKRRRVAPRASG